MIYLHERKKLHRDIKAGNILLDIKGITKLADFGVSTQLRNTQQYKETVIGTPFWMSPEVISNSKYGPKTDIWSLGVILYELVFGRLPWDGKDEKALLTNILSQKLKFPSTISP